MQSYPDIKRLVIFSRDEQKQFNMSNEFSQKKYPAIRYFIGDIRDEKYTYLAQDNAVIVGVKMSRGAVLDEDEDEEGAEGAEGAEAAPESAPAQ